MPGSRPLVHVVPLLVDVAKPMAHAPPSKMRPTWNAETIVEPFENVSGSTSVLWLVVLDAAHVPCMNGSELMSTVAAPAVAGSARTAMTRATLESMRRQYLCEPGGLQPTV